MLLYTANSQLNEGNEGLRMKQYMVHIFYSSCFVYRNLSLSLSLSAFPSAIFFKDNRSVQNRFYRKKSKLSSKWFLLLLLSLDAHNHVDYSGTLGDLHLLTEFNMEDAFFYTNLNPDITWHDEIFTCNQKKSETEWLLAF